MEGENKQDMLQTSSKNNGLTKQCLAVIVITRKEKLLLDADIPSLAYEEKFKILCSNIKFINRVLRKIAEFGGLQNVPH